MFPPRLWLPPGLPPGCSSSSPGVYEGPGTLAVPPDSAMPPEAVLGLLGHSPEVSVSAAPSQGSWLMSWEAAGTPGAADLPQVSSQDSENEGALLGSARSVLPVWQGAWSPACWGQGWTVFGEVGSGLGWAAVTVPRPGPGRPPLPRTSCALARRGAPPPRGQGCGCGPRCCAALGSLAVSGPASWVAAGQPAQCTPPAPSCAWSPREALSPGSPWSCPAKVRVPGTLDHWVGGGVGRRLGVHPGARCTLGGSALGSHAESQWRGPGSPY